MSGLEDVRFREVPLYFDIGWELEMNLVRPQIEARPRVELHSSLPPNISVIPGKEVEPIPTLTNTNTLPRHDETKTKQRCV